MWALTESGLGGLLHAVRMPLMGLIMAGLAMTLITLIAHHSDRPARTIGKALLLVLIVKLVGSPHSSISGYLAVTFQAGLAMLLYGTIGLRWLSIFLLALIGTLESALQKVISLVILFGESFWQALDELGAWITEYYAWLIPLGSAEAMVSTYAGIYAIGGLLWGVFIYALRQKIIKTSDLEQYQIEFDGLETDVTIGHGNKKKSNRKLKFWLTMAVLALLVILTPYLVQDEYSNWQRALYVLGRTILILGVWFVVVSPLLMKALSKYLRKKQGELSTDIDQVFGLFPYLKSILSHVWKETQGSRSWRRVPRFFFRGLMYCMHFEIPKS